MKSMLNLISVLFFLLFIVCCSFALAETTPNQVVKEFLTSASLGDSSKAINYLSQKADRGIVDTFINLFKNPGGPWSPSDRSGWVLTTPAEWKVDEKIDENNQDATVIIVILWKGGSPPTHISMGRTFSLVKENNNWKISKFTVGRK